MAIWGPDRVPTSRTSEDWADHTFYEDSDYQQKGYPTDRTTEYIATDAQQHHIRN